MTNDVNKFFDKVEKSSTCWIWTGLLNNDGYGEFGYDGKVVMAHRFSYELVKGKIPDNTELDHLCRNRACVNPEHLEPTTHQVNLLRGDTIIAKNAQATCCPKGHPYDLLNTYITPKGFRDCRICRSEAHRRYVEKHSS